IRATTLVLGSRPQRQSRSPNYSPMQDYWVSKWDHQHHAELSATNTSRNPRHSSQVRHLSATHTLDLQPSLLWGPPSTNMRLPQWPPSWDSATTEIDPYAQ
ncbi:Hypothetical predicted protein, partial [Marmota monax]